MTCLRESGFEAETMLLGEVDDPRQFRDLACVAATLMDCATGFVTLRNGEGEWIAGEAPVPRDGGRHFLCGAPLVVDGRLAGVLHVAHPTPRKPTSVQVAALEALARQASSHLASMHANERIRESERLLRASAEVSFDTFGVLSAVRDESGEVVDFRFDFLNGQAGGFFGRDAEELVGKSLLANFPAATAHALAERFREVLRSGVDFEQEYVSQMPGKRGRWVRLQAARTGDRIAVTGRDVHERRTAELALKESEEKLATSLGALQVGVMLVSRDGEIVQSNAAAARILGTEMAFLPGEGLRSEFEILDPEGEAMAPAARPIARSLRGESVRNADMVLRWADGHDRWVRANAEPLWRDGESTPYAVVCSFEDVTVEREQRRVIESANRRLERLATTDGLTGLANRREFDERLAAELGSAAESGRAFSLALLDIDHFKALNDDYGHLTGDAVLRRVAQVLERSRDRDHLAARYGGEEFAILMPGADVRSAWCRADRLRQLVAGQAWDNRPITASFGVATLRPGMTPATLIEAADRALYESKRAGRNRTTHSEAPSDGG